MSTTEAFFTAFTPHLLGGTLCALRLLPITVLCPLLGGAALTSTVRLAVTLALAGALQFNGATHSSAVVRDLPSFMLAGCAELALGIAIGFLSSLPFEAARVAGRFIDTFRGASAEVTLPLVGSHEAASGELLHQLLIVGAVVTGAFGDFIQALWLSFGAVPVGTWSANSPSAQLAISALTAAFGVAFIIGAPVACIALLIEAGTGLAARLAPKLSIHDLAAPLRLLAGAVLLFFATESISARLLVQLQSVPDQLATLQGAVP